MNEIFFLAICILHLHFNFLYCLLCLSLKKIKILHGLWMCWCYIWLIGVQLVMHFRGLDMRLIQDGQCWAQAHSWLSYLVYFGKKQSIGLKVDEGRIRRQIMLKCCVLWNGVLLIKLRLIQMFMCLCTDIEASLFLVINQLSSLLD